MASQEKEFPIIESYCFLSEKDKENNNRNQSEINNLVNEYNGNNYLKINDKDRGNESKIEAKQVEDLKNCVNKILDEF